MGSDTIFRSLFFITALALHTHPSAVAQTLRALSSDGRIELRADNDARELIALDAATGALIKRIAVADRRGVTSRVARVLDAPPRRSFIALLSDIPEAWELSYDPQAEPVFDGMVHDYRMGEGLATRGPLPVRRIVLDEPLTDALFDADFAHFIARTHAGNLHVVNLHVGRRIETIAVRGDPRPERGSVRRCGDDTLLFLIPDGTRPVEYAIDARDWRLRGTH